MDTIACLMLMFGTQDSKLAGSGLSCGKDQCVVFVGKTHFSLSVSQCSGIMVSS